MTIHLCKEKYRLELHWSSVKYIEKGVIKLIGAYFSGPVLSEVNSIKQEDFIDLDFTSQYSKLVSSFHIARLSWFSARRPGGAGKIELGNPIIATEYENEISKLKDKDYVVIDTSDHEEKTHANNLVYKSFIVKESGCDKYE
jgi:hypothetical protein